MGCDFLVVTFLVLVSLSCVISDDAEEEEKKIAKEIGDNICKDDDRSSDWFNCIMCCQGMNPYTLKKDTECNKEARDTQYGNPSLTSDTKSKMCGAMADYSDTLKKKVLDLKGDVKSSCSTDDGMKDYFDKKLDCFRKCEDTPGDYQNFCKD